MTHVLIPALRRWRQEDHLKYRASLNYIANRPFFKTTKREKSEQAISRSRSHGDCSLKLEER